MATLPKPLVDITPEHDAAAKAALEMARLLEEHFNEMGWSEAERDARVTASSKRINAAVRNATR